MRASLYRLVAGRPVVATQDGRRRRATAQELLDYGYAIVGTLDGHEVVQAAPGVGAPEGAEVLKDGEVEPWSWGDLRRDDPELADAVLHSRIRLTRDGEDRTGDTEVVREPVADAITRDDSEVIESDLPPHGWAGDR